LLLLKQKLIKTTAIIESLGGKGCAHRRAQCQRDAAFQETRSFCSDMVDPRGAHHSAKLNCIDPQEYLTDVLERIVSGRTKNQQAPRTLAVVLEGSGRVHLDFAAWRLIRDAFAVREGIYDPRLPNDRLVLGMKGTMSEMEVASSASARSRQ
jgi:hypothetical protein